MNSRWLLAAALFAALGVPASAQTWNQTAAGTYAWNLDANWSAAPFPNSPTAVANVNNDIAGDQTIELNQLIDLNALTVGDGSATTPSVFTIAAGTGGSLQFNGTATLTGTANTVKTISAPITLLGGLTITQTGANAFLNLTGGINTGAGAGAQTLTFSTSGDSTGATNRGINVAAPITGDGNVVKSDANFINFTAANTYTGTTTINAGAIRLSGAGTLGSGNLTLAGGQFFPGATFTRAVGTAAGEVQWTGNNAFGTIGQPLTVNLGGAAAGLTWGVGGFLTPTGNLGLGTASSDNTVTFVNPIDLGGAVRTVDVLNGSAAIDAVLSGVLSGAGSGLTKAGPGTLEVTGANTYDGGTTVSGGAVRIGSDGANPGNPSPLGAVPAAPANNPMLTGGGLIQYSAAFTLHPNRQLGLGTGGGGLDTGGFDITLPNKVTGTSSTGIVNFIKAGAGALTLTAPAGTNDYNSTATPPDPVAGSIFPTATLTTVAGGTLVIGATNTLPTAAGLMLGSGTSTGNVDLSSFDQTVAALTAVSNNAGASNTITIGAGRTLSVVNPTAPVGGPNPINRMPFVILNNIGSTAAPNARTNVTITGPGALVVNTPQSPFHAGQAGSLPAFGNLGTVDMSGLATFTATVSEVRVGDFGNGSNPGATILTLAANSTITAGSAISVGTSGRFTNSGPAGFQANTLRLGSGTTVLNTNNVYIGSNVRNTGDTTSTINLITTPRASGAVVFNGPTGTLTLRASDGTGRSNIFLAALGAGTAANRANTFDVTGHAVDLLLGQLVVGAPNAFSTTVGGPGTLDNVFSFDNGILDVNTIAVARQAGTTTTTTLANMSGTVNLGGGTVIVNTGPITLATVTGTGATGAGTTVTNTGTLNVSGGTVTVLGGGVTLGNNTATNLGSLVAALNVSGGTLTVGGPIGPGAVTVRVTSNLTLSGGTLNMQGNDIGNLTNVTFTNGTLRNLGTLSRDLTQSGGTLLRDAAGTTTISGAYSLTGGTARVLAGGTLTTTGGLTASGTGIVLGTGQITGTVTLGGGGTIQGGDGGATAADELTIPGGMTLTGANTLRAVVADTTVGNATADPAASLIDLGAGTLTGSGGLTTIKLSAAPGTLDFNVQYTVTLATFGATSNLAVTDFTIDPNPEGFVFAGTPSLNLTATTLMITFTPTPEPGAMLLVSGLAAVVAAGWRRSRSPRPAPLQAV